MEENKNKSNSHFFLFTRIKLSGPAPVQSYCSGRTGGLATPSVPRCRAPPEEASQSPTACCCPGDGPRHQRRAWLVKGAQCRLRSANQGMEAHLLQAAWRGEACCPWLREGPSSILQVVSDPACTCDILDLSTSVSALFMPHRYKHLSSGCSTATEDAGMSHFTC